MATPAPETTASIPATEIVASQPRLIIKILYPRVCTVLDSDLDNILEDLHKKLSEYCSITLQASRSEDPANVGLWKATTNWIVGDQDTSAPYCRTMNKDGTSPEHTLLIEVLTNDSDGLRTNVADIISSAVKSHIKPCAFKILPVFCVLIN